MQRSLFYLLVVIALLVLAGFWSSSPAARDPFTGTSAWQIDEPPPSWSEKIQGVSNKWIGWPSAPRKARSTSVRYSESIP